MYTRRRRAGGGKQNGNRKGRKELTEGQKGEEKEGEKGREAKAGMGRTREESSDADVIKSYSHIKI